MSDPVEHAHKEGEEDTGGHFEPVIKLTEQIEAKTHEEDEDVLFKMRAKLFRFETTASEWKERGTGEVRLLAHKVTQRCRLVMRRDKTFKVCANHSITSDMRLQPNIGSDRSWVWKVAADVSDGEPTSETLAIRFANAENANNFKAEFEKAQKVNAELTAAAAAPKPAAEPAHVEPAKEEKEEEKKEEVEAKAAEAEAAHADPAPVTHATEASEGDVAPAPTGRTAEATHEDTEADALAKKTADLKVEDPEHEAAEKAEEPKKEDEEKPNAE